MGTTSTMTTDSVLSTLAGEYYYVFERRHPYYVHTYPIWKHATNAYKGGRQYVRKTLTKHPSETADEFKYDWNTPVNDSKPF